MKLGFDIISDLNLVAEDDFDWEGKASSLYLIIAGNISNDLVIVRQTLFHLSQYYKSIFYIHGESEIDSMHFMKQCTSDISDICDGIENVTYLHKQIVIINDVAIIGCCGWHGNRIEPDDDLARVHIAWQNMEDIRYLEHGITKLQLYPDVRNILVVSHSVPGESLFFGEEPSNISEYLSLIQVTEHDSNDKISHWIYGCSEKKTDIVIDNIRYINNAHFNNEPYWPVRIEV